MQMNIMVRVGTSWDVVILYIGERNRLVGGGSGDTLGGYSKE